ncbi:MAG: urea carboxylase-associated family protein [Gammaproteobacteria bacterium]|nr:urea carboxylase-associated family protein [Gammaproteobacteria bacterium]
MTATPFYQDTLPGGRHWSFIARRGVTLRLCDVDGDGNVGMLLYNPQNPLERLNLPDTLKCQHTFKLTTGNCLYSDMGRIFCSIIADDVGWHDASSGTCNAALVEAKWGNSNYQQARNDYYRNGRDSFLIELGKYGLGKRDLAANVNWFSRVDVSNAGDMRLADGHSQAGACVSLRFEMDTLVVLHSCAHPLNGAETYPYRPVGYELAVAEPVAADDHCRLACAANERGFANNDLYLLGV